MTRDDEGPAGPQGAAGRGRRAGDGGEAADALVAEATRLADAFSSWVGGVGGADGTGRPGGADTGEPAPTSDEDSPSEPVGEEPAADGAAAPAPMACDCGRTAGLDAICRVCPVCRIASYMHTVRPEVLVRVADVLAMVAGSLQMIAADRSSDPQAAPRQASTNDAEDGPHRPDPRPADTGVPIPVRGDDDPTAPERH